jgi:hypothetical protein
MLNDRDMNEVPTTPDQSEARQMLEDLCHNGFEGPHMAALALGRAEADLNAMLEGSEEVDADLVMKIRGLASERNIPIESPE